MVAAWPGVGLTVPMRFWSSEHERYFCGQFLICSQSLYPSFGKRNVNICDNNKATFELELERERDGGSAAVQLIYVAQFYSDRLKKAQ